MGECESITNYGSDSTAVMPEDCCPLCSGKYSYVYHAGHCPQIKAKEYHPNGRVRRIEFTESSGTRIAGFHQGNMKGAPDFDTLMELVDSTAREVVIEEPTLLEPGRYTIVLGELFRIVVDDVPPSLEPLPDEGRILQALVDRALQESPSSDWERELDEL